MGCLVNSAGKKSWAFLPCRVIKVSEEPLSFSTVDPKLPSWQFASLSYKRSSERLFEKVTPFMGDSIGVSADAIAKMSLTADVVEDILKCLRDTDTSELKIGLVCPGGAGFQAAPRVVAPFDRRTPEMDQPRER